MIKSNILPENLHVEFVCLPGSVHGLCCKDSGTDPIGIYINETIAPALQIKAIEHELYHILNGHLDSDVSVKELETETKNYCETVKHSKRTNDIEREYIRQAGNKDKSNDLIFCYIKALLEEINE